MTSENLKNSDATASDIVPCVDMTVRGSTKDSMIEDDKRILYDLNFNLQDVLIDTIRTYAEFDKLNLNSTVLDDSEIIQHKKLLIAITKKIELIIKYLNQINKDVSEYDKFDLINLKLEYEVANTINDFLMETLPAEDIIVEDDDLTELQWIKTKTDADAEITKKFIRASKR